MKSAPTFKNASFAKVSVHDKNGAGTARRQRLNFIKIKFIEYLKNGDEPSPLPLKGSLKPHSNKKTAFRITRKAVFHLFKV